MSREASLPDPSHVTALVRRLDLRVLVPAVLLVMMGLLSIASDQPSLLGAQMRWWSVGMVVLLGIVLVPYPRLLSMAYTLYGVSMLLLVLVLIRGIGVERNGGMRWLTVGGVNVQPSELAKVAHVLALARYVRFRRDHRTFKGLVVPFLLTLAPMALILKQPDLGTALMMVPVLFAVLWVAGARSKHLAFVILLGVASLPVLYGAMAPHQKRRVRAFVPFVAQVDGASGWRVLKDVTLPQLLPVLAVVLILKAIFSLKTFDQVYMLTNGGPGTATQTLSHYVYFNGLKYSQIGYSAAVAWLMVIPMIFLTYAYAKFVFQKK